MYSWFVVWLVRTGINWIVYDIYKRLYLLHLRLTETLFIFLSWVHLFLSQESVSSDRFCSTSIPLIEIYRISEIREMAASVFYKEKKTKIALNQVFVPKLALKAKIHKNSTQRVEFRVYNLGFRVYSLGFRVEKWGFGDKISNFKK